MPRPKTIPWDTRVKIFLAYRRAGGKVNPVAKNHSVARSTVTAIVGEFKEMGFSNQPRAKVPIVLLKELQEGHLKSLLDLPSRGVGLLNLGPGTDNEAGIREAAANPLPFSQDSIWHLRGTEAEQTIKEAKSAVSNYLERELRAWQGLQQTLEASCQLQEHSEECEDTTSFLFPDPKRLLRNIFFDEAFLLDPPPQSWLQWDVDPSEVNVLRLNGSRAAVGSPDDHRLVKDGLSSFLLNDFKERQSHFLEIERLRHDMMLLQGIVSRSLAAVPEDTIRRGICPGCPYPEATLDIEPAP